MTTSPLLIAAAVVATWFLVFVGLHLHGLRAGRSNARWLIQAFIGCLAGVLLTVVTILNFLNMQESIVLALVIAALTASCLFILYVPALYTVLTSLSVATLLHLLQNGGRAAEPQLYDRFATLAILEQRLAVLVDNRHLGREGNGVRLTPRGRAIARIFAAIKGLWRLGPGG